MNYLVKNRKLELKYVPGNGAWTYHLVIPNTKNLVGKWGSLKVAGTIDNYPIESLNLAKIGEGDKLISINGKIRKAIQKKGGDSVTVSLYLLHQEKQWTKEDIIESFHALGVLEAFLQLSRDEQQDITQDILSQKSQELQLKKLTSYVDSLTAKRGD